MKKLFTTLVMMTAYIANAQPQPLTPEKLWQ